MSRITVGPKDCVDSIAFRHGLLWKSVWNHAENSALKESRKDPNVLLENDEVFVPEIELREESAATEQRHRYRRHGLPSKVKIRILVDDDPVANAPCTLVIDGVSRELETDGDGFIQAPIMPDASRGELRVRRGNKTSIYTLNLGGLRPLDTREGVRDRLKGLGYAVGDDESFDGAVRKFRDKNGLEPDGGIDDPFRSKLKESFGQ